MKVSIGYIKLEEYDSIEKTRFLLLASEQEYSKDSKNAIKIDSSWDSNFFSSVTVGLICFSKVSMEKFCLRRFWKQNSSFLVLELELRLFEYAKVLLLFLTLLRCSNWWFAITIELSSRIQTKTFQKNTFDFFPWIRILITQKLQSCYVW